MATRQGRSRDCASRSKHCARMRTVTAGCAAACSARISTGKVFRRSCLSCRMDLGYLHRVTRRLTQPCPNPPCKAKTKGAREHDGAAPRRHPPTTLPTRHVQARHPKPCASDGVGLQPFYHRSLPPSLSPSQAKPSQQAARPPSTSSTDSQSINLPPPSPAPGCAVPWARSFRFALRAPCSTAAHAGRSEEHTSELQSPKDLVCRLLLEKKKKH